MASDPAPIQNEEWCLVDREGHQYNLPKTMLFMGREECDIVVRSQSVDKRHAVITFDHYLSKFKLKDLSTVNGTYVNESRIHDQEYVTLEHMDSVRLGYDSTVYRMKRVKTQPEPEIEEGYEHSHVQHAVPPCMPSWATRELPHMAECEGCIAEQSIAHTCGNHEVDNAIIQHEHMEYAYHSYHDDEKSKQSDSSLGSNTWPRKRLRNMPNIATYFQEDINSSRVSIDDNDYTYACSRVLRGEGGHPENLPPELETVKKGTPLYGQPDWWGEEDSREPNGNIRDYSSTRSKHVDRPDNLSVSKNDNSQYCNKKSISPSELKSMASSISKDSLLSQQTITMTTPESPGQSGQSEDSKVQTSEEVSSVSSSKPSDMNTSMAFTVDFDDISPKINMSGKLSEFVPSKIRRSFKERKEKVAIKSASKETTPRETIPEKDQGTQEISTPNKQKKIEDLWSSESSTKKPKTSDVKRPMKSSETEKKPEATTKSSGVKTHRRNLSSGTPIKAKLSKPKENGHQATDHSTPNVTDSASYLIDKMFETNTKTPPVKGRKTPRTSTSERFTEHAMYKEAKQYEHSKGKSSETTRDTAKGTTRDTTKGKKGTTVGAQKKEVSKPLPVSARNKTPDKVEDPKGNDSDNVSEAGTYTIEADKESKEESTARQSIDKVFGISDSAKQTVSETVDSEHIEATSTARSGELTLVDIEDEIKELEKERSAQPEASSLDVEVGSTALQELKIVEDNENPSESLPSDAPSWVTQWAALTSQKPKKMEAPSPSSVHSSFSDKDIQSDSKKPPHGLSRKRPGTGRRLPTIPPDKSPDGSNCSSRLSQSTDSQSPRCPSTPRYGENNNLNDSSKLKAVTISSRVVNRYEDTDTETVSRTKFESDAESTIKSDLISSPKSSTSTRSVASIDTELLLKDTETVMAAMEARMETKSLKTQNGDILENGDEGQYSDSESMVAMVNGDESYTKPSQFSSPRENLAKSKSNKQHKPLTRLNSAGARLQAFREKNYKRNSVGGSVVSDVLSETNQTEAECSSVHSDYSADQSDTSASFNRSGSKGKGTITMTRPNRAFQLRRAKADGEPPESPSTSVTGAPSLTNVSDSSRTVSSAGSATPTRSNRSSNRQSYPSSRQDSSARSNVSLGAKIVQQSRSQGTDRHSEVSARSDASLGAQIAQKAQSNAPRPMSGNFYRSDGGRHSLKLSRSLSTQDSIHTDSSSSTRKPDLKSLKSRLKTTPSFGLAVTGVSSRSSTSSLHSGTGSPKSAEKAAWKRRKEYDPRRAVAEAKAKAKDVKVKADSQGKPKMVRSASFTNSAELQKFRRDAYQKNDSVSSTDDISCASEGTDAFDDRRFQRGFIPYSARSQSSRLYQSEEEELSLMVKSSQDLNHSVVGNVPYKSAFTPPPPKSDPSPTSPPLLPLSVFKKRFSKSSHENRQSPSKTSQNSSGTADRQSYDNILVSSIYQLSLKLKTNTDKTLQKLRENQRIENGSSPSPIDDIINQSNSGSEIPGWKTANQELAGILNNLRKIDHHINVVHKVLFPDDDSCSDSPGLSGREKREYLQEIERIRGELAGFQPISTPDSAWQQTDDQVSIESDCEELGTADEFF